MMQSRWCKADEDSAKQNNIKTPVVNILNSNARVHCIIVNSVWVYLDIIQEQAQLDVQLHGKLKMLVLMFKLVTKPSGLAAKPTFKLQIK